MLVNRKVCNSGNCNRQLESFKDHYLMVKRANLRILGDVFESCPQTGVGGGGEEGGEPSSIKMAMSFTGTALEAIRGLGVSEPEYNEAKEILQYKLGSE